MLALSVGFGASVTAQAANDLSLGSTCLNCSPEKLQKYAKSHSNPDIKRSGETPLPSDYTRITADKVEGQTNVKVRAEGDVIIERNDQVLNAQWVDYDQTNETVTAGDQFVLYQNGSTVSGSNLQYKLSDGTGVSHNARLEAEQDGRRLQSVSEKAEMQGNGRYKLINTQFNTCSPGDASWFIKAKSIEADQNTGIGVAKNASLVFGGVPVLYTPWVDFPLNGHRKSGLLVPNLTIGSDGLEFDLPYYMNLAPNYDATIAPGFIARRGVRLGGQFRYLDEKFAGQVEGSWMPNDRKSVHNNRYQAKLDHRHQFTDNLRGGVEYHQVSDDDYYRDFYGREDIARNVNLNRQIWLNYDQQLWGGNVSSYFTAQK